MISFSSKLISTFGVVSNATLMYFNLFWISPKSFSEPSTDLLNSATSFWKDNNAFLSVAGRVVLFSNSISKDFGSANFSVFPLLLIYGVRLFVPGKANWPTSSEP